MKTVIAGESKHALLKPVRWALARVVIALGITQIISWGSLYYSVSVLAGPMATGLGLSQAMVFGAFSLALAVSGFASPTAGRAIDRHGGRAVMAAGSVLAALALGLIAMADGLLVFMCGWVVVGLAMACTLYDAAFPTLSQLAGLRYRQALTALTLFGGLASTAFWPLAWQINEGADWRTALGIFALMHLLICLPLHRWGLPRAAPGLTKAELAPHQHKVGATPVGLLQRWRGIDRRFLWLAAAFALNAFVFSAIAAHVVAALAAAGQSFKAAVFAAALIGPMQVAGRVVEFVWARRWPAQHVGVACLVGVIVAMILLSQADYAIWIAPVFAVLYGASNGVMTIVRGMVPSELFGRERYGALMGALAQPSFFAKASAPLLASLLFAAGWSYSLMAMGLALLSVLAFVCFLAALRPTRAALPEADTGLSVSK